LYEKKWQDIPKNQRDDGIAQVKQMVAKNKGFIQWGVRRGLPLVYQLDTPPMETVYTEDHFWKMAEYVKSVFDPLFQ
jgi:hypothetical protein